MPLLRHFRLILFRVLLYLYFNATTAGPTQCDFSNPKCGHFPAFGEKWTTDFTDQAAFEQLVGLDRSDGSMTADGDMGLRMRRQEKSDVPIITVAGYIFFGRVNITLRAVKGDGLVTRIALLSAANDYIGIEFDGSETHLYKSTYYRHKQSDDHERMASQDETTSTHIVRNDTTSNFHHYSIDWRPEELVWYVDGEISRRETPSDISDYSFPQTPSQCMFGIWYSGGKISTGKTESVNIEKGTAYAYIKSLSIEDYTGGIENATGYAYDSSSGDWKTVMVETNEGIFQPDPTRGSIGPKGEKPSTPAAEDDNHGRRHGLGAGAIVGIVIGSLGALVAIVLFFHHGRSKRMRKTDPVPRASRGISSSSDKPELHGNPVSELEGVAHRRSPVELDGSNRVLAD